MNDNLPSDRKFGLFFSAVFLVLAAYLYWYHHSDHYIWTGGLAVVFFAVAMIAPKCLRLLNKAWAMIGRGLGMIVSPVVLGVIFYLLISPIAIVLRLSGRDELGLKAQRQHSHWKIRENRKIPPESFKQQF